ncbi:MAG: peptidase M28, partial [Staphylococcus equorum]
MKTLTELHGAPGFEDDVKAYLKSELEPFVDEFVYNRMGGIYGVKRSKIKNPKRVMVAAHMDEIGFMITNITENGMIQFTNLGGVATDIWQGQRLKVKSRKNEEIIGVVANIPKHFRTGNEGAPKIEDLLLDIGCENPKEVRKRGIEIGDSIVPETPFTQLSEHRFSSKAWDNRYGCLLGIELLELLKDVELGYDLYVGA